MTEAGNFQFVELFKELIGLDEINQRAREFAKRIPPEIPDYPHSEFMFNQNKALQRKLRVISFSLLTPFFFIKAGMNVSLPDIYSNLGLLCMLFLVKLGPKIIGVYPFAKMYVPKDAVYTTLLMSTGLTLGVELSTEVFFGHPADTSVL